MSYDFQFHSFMLAAHMICFYLYLRIFFCCLNHLLGLHGESLCLLITRAINPILITKMYILNDIHTGGLLFVSIRDVKSSYLSYTIFFIITDEYTL